MVWPAVSRRRTQESEEEAANEGYLAAGEFDSSVLRKRREVCGPLATQGCPGAAVCAHALGYHGYASSAKGIPRCGVGGQELPE